MSKYYIGLDQSSKVTGYGVIDDKGQLIDFGIVDISGRNVIERATKLIRWLDGFLAKYDDDEYIVGLEDVKGSIQNYQTTIVLAKILGILELTLHEQNIDYQVIAPGTWRKINKIKGKTRPEKKANAIKVIKERYNKKVKEDAAEALCIAYHLFKNDNWSAF